MMTVMMAHNVHVYTCMTYVYVTRNTQHIKQKTENRKQRRAVGQWGPWALRGDSRATRAWSARGKYLPGIFRVGVMTHA